MNVEPRAAIPLDDVPVFPLPGVVLLPEQRLPLHIFEPRYRAMVRDALEGHGYLAVALLTGPPDAPSPSFAAVATVGKIVAHQKLPDGRFNILVEGQVRVSLDELAASTPYRRARATLLGDPLTDAAEVRPALRAALLSVSSQVVRAARAKQPRFDFDAPTELPSARLALRLVDRFVTAAPWRQRVLEAETASGRVALATEALAEVLAEGGSLQVSGTA
jgi:Lon protease-like protein